MVIREKVKDFALICFIFSTFVFATLYFLKTIGVL
jgi:hypothetical protein